MDYELVLDGQEYFVSISKGKNGYTAKIGDEEFSFEQIDFETACLKLNVNGVPKTVYVAGENEKCYVHVDGLVHTLEIPSEESSAGAGSSDLIVDGKQLVVAPMPGKIVDIPVKVGQAVKEKDILCVVEAMKMENEIRCMVKGVVKEIGYKAGDLVGTEETILIVEAAEE